MRPIPPTLLVAQFALCGVTALLYATAGSSARRKSFAVGLNALAFAGLLVATAHGIVAQEGFCPSCLLVWISLGVGLLSQSGASPFVRWWLPAVLAGSLVLRAGARGTGESALLIQDRLRNGLSAVGFEYRLPRTTLRSGDALPDLKGAKGLTVFLTKCGPCTRKVLEASLAQRAVRPEAVTFVVADTTTGWQTPSGYQGSRRIVDARSWARAGIVPFGPPCLVRLEKGRVQEVLF